MTLRSRWRALFTAFAFIQTFAAQARSDCVLDKCADPAPAAQNAAPSSRQEPGAAKENAKFEFYVLALSWSAGFCETVNGARDQCEPGKGLGFVVHGLWPQHEYGFPADCATNLFPTRVALDKAAGLFPDDRLARHEWRKHGACTGLSPSDYFAAVARARALVTIPPAFEKRTQEQSASPLDVERAFYDANPRLRPGMMAVSCRRGVMDGVRLCLQKDLREFRACPNVARRGCHAQRITIPAPL
ncbi:MAG: ribonuclease T [Methylocystis sp.]|nr:ribonuclease T [Methylocystis sp.]